MSLDRRYSTDSAKVGPEQTIIDGFAERSVILNQGKQV